MGSLSRLERKSNRNCSLCGHSFSKDKTQCPSCKKLNVEIAPDMSTDGTVLLTETKALTVARIQTGCWDTNWGSHREGKTTVGGIVDTSVSLLGGAPGAGKSTLAMQMAAAIAKLKKREVLYICGEESEGEIRARAERLNIGLDIQKLFRIVPMGIECNLSFILDKRQPCATFIDSLPGVMPDPSDAVEFAWKLKSWSVANHMPSVIIDHVTKEEEFAGMMALQHAVDGTFIFTVYDDGVRELKTVKNRNGPSGIVTTLDMTEEGLVYRSPDDDDDEDDDE